MNFGNVVDVHRFSSWRPLQSDPRLPMLQIAKERYLRVQLTDLYKMRPEPIRGRTLIFILVSQNNCEIFIPNKVDL